MKKIIFAILFTTLTVSVSAQYIAPFFTTMPSDIFSYLSLNNRKDLIDLFQSGKPPKVENLLKGSTELKSFGDDFISLQLSSSSTAQMKLLPLNDTVKIIAIIKTVSGKATDSQIDFYSSTWDKLKISNLLPSLSLNDFINKQALAANQDSTILQALDILFISYSFTKESNTLTASLDAQNYLSKEDFSKLTDILKPSISLKWVNGKFEKE